MTRTRKREALSFGAPYLREAAARRRWSFTLHPDGGFAGQIRMDDGSVRNFVRSTYDINRSGAAAVARDKGLTKFFLAEAGFPVIAGETFFSDRLCAEIGATRGVAAARRYASGLGYPVIVKPNSGFAGEGVTRVARRGELDAALAHAFTKDDVILIERYIAGLRDFRVVVLDGELLLAYERRPFSISGDGVSTIRTLVDRFRRTAAARRLGRPDPERLHGGLAAAGLTWSDVLAAGQTVRLLDVANLSQGGTAAEVTEVHPSIVRLAVDAARAIGLRYCGADLLARDLGNGRGRRYIIELNASPTIHQFATLCGLSSSRLAALHEHLLAAMGRAG